MPPVVTHLWFGPCAERALQRKGRLSADLQAVDCADCIVVWRKMLGACTSAVDRQLATERDRLRALRQEIETVQETLSPLRMEKSHLDYEIAERKRTLAELRREINRAHLERGPTPRRAVVEQPVPAVPRDEPPPLEAIVGPLAEKRRQDGAAYHAKLLAEMKAPPEPSADQLAERHAWLTEMLARPELGKDHAARAHFEQRLADHESAMRVLLRRQAEKGT